MFLGDAKQKVEELIALLGEDDDTFEVNPNTKFVDEEALEKKKLEKMMVVFFL